MSEPLIASEHLSKTFQTGAKEVCALSDVSMRIERGESVAIIGPSGAGKSTLLHIIGGLDSPSAGRVLFDGRDISGLKDRERAQLRNKRVGFVFQSFHLLPEFTALENVILPGLILAGFKRPVSLSSARMLRDRARELMSRLGISHREDHRPNQLSGGESQRVAIARALINGPDVLLCDEPTGNLDSDAAFSIGRLLNEFRDIFSMTVVIVTHNEAMANLTERTVRIVDGRIAVP